MESTVIVALPSVGDSVYKISSEEVPHLTLLYLGEVELSAEAVLYVQHAVRELSPFGLSVDYRGTLGDDEADVVFFEKNAWDLDRIADFRHHLLLNDEIKRAYDSVEQFPEWTPHLTLGYPETPAKDEEEFRRFHYVDFDRVAVWNGSYEGPEFRLKYADHAMEVAMSDISTLDRGAAAAAEMFGVVEGGPELKQYGVKGMRWGVRKDQATSKGGASSGPTSVVVTQKKPGKYAKATGGKAYPLSDDARAALELRQKAKASTTDALSNQELQKAITRMNLENQFHNAQFSSDRRSKGARFVAGLLGHKRYGKKRPFTDSTEEIGGHAREAIKTVQEVRKAS